MYIRKYKFLVLFYTILTIYTGCTSTQSSVITKKDGIPVILDVSDNIKLDAFKISVTKYFRRYNPTLKNDGTFSVQYGKYPVIVSFDNERIYIESSIPEKHALWLLNINKLMKSTVDQK